MRYNPFDFMKKSKRMMIPPGANEWYAGVPLQGTRKLLPEERYELQVQQGRFRFKGCVALLLAPALLAIALAVPLLMDLSFLSDSFVPPLMLALMFMSTWLLLVGRENVRYGRWLKADLRAGYLKQFGSPDAEQPTLLEVLPVSNRLWRMNGDILPTWANAPPVWVADVPEMAHVAAEWVLPVEGAPVDEPHTNWRTLSSAEKQELTRHARRLALRLLPASLFFTAWFGILVGVALHEHGVPPSSLQAIVLLMITLAINWGLIRHVLQSKRVVRDRDVGQIVVLRWLRQEENQAADSPPSLSPPMEVLPHSRLIWTENGRAAHWRLAR
jgi:hypothetical protein